MDKKRKSGEGSGSGSKRPHNAETPHQPSTMAGNRDDESLVVNRDSADLTGEPEQGGTGGNDELLPEESSLSPNIDEETTNIITTRLAEIQKKIDDNDHTQDLLRERVRDTESLNKAGNEIFRVWDISEQQRNDLISKSLEISMLLRLYPPEEQKKELTQYMVLERNSLRGLYDAFTSLQRQIDALIEEKKRLEEQNQDRFLVNNQNDEESGMFYIVDSFRIGLETDPSSNIGLLEKKRNGSSLKTKQNLFASRKF